MNITQAFRILTDAQHEGRSFVDDPHDPGGATKFGISQAAYPNVDIANLTAADAMAIYQRDYWDKVQADALPDAARYEVFDCAVNQGVATAIRLLQTALGIAVDGVIGPATLAAAQAADGPALLRHFQGRRILMYAGMSQWPLYGRGWIRRVAFNMLEV